VPSRRARPLADRGVGPETAAAGDGPERLRSDAALAALCGASPVEASSGKTRRDCVNRGGDRQGNGALWTIATNRMLHDPETRTYVDKRTAEGKSTKEIRRCCPGGDAQPQGIFQVLLHLLLYGANPQEAIEAPRVTRRNFPNAFAPHEYLPGVVDVEARVNPEARRGLSELGHVVHEAAASLVATREELDPRP
jgi:Gamma-glutamyltranspeptidase/Transposase IS116/IS110/IS902 family